MRVVISGGAGFIGRGVVAALLARSIDVTVLTRDVRAAREKSDGRVRLAAWDPTRAETWADTVRECDAVINLAGEGVADKRWTKNRKAALRASRVDTTARLARVIGGATGGPRVFINASAVGYYGMRDDDGLRVEGDASGDDFLARLCVDWESAAEPARASGARIALPRLGVVLGHDSGALAKMLPPFKLFVGGPLGAGNQWMSWIHVSDAVRGIVHALDHAELDGAYNLTAPNPVTMNEFAHSLGDAVGRPSIARVPSFALKLAMGRERAGMLLRGQRVLPRRLEEAGFRFEFPTLASALADLLPARAA